jgi:phage terminase large subunit-like protein
MPPEPPRLSLSLAFDNFEGRKESRKTLLGFSLIYLTGYFTDPPATFHAQLVHALEDEAERRVLILGFRGSGKSTFGSLALPLWAALEYPEKYPFIILIADSSRQATLNISAIKHELETNSLIKQDYGEIKGNVIEDFTLQGEGEEWQKQNIVLSNGVRILARSRGQKVRGLRHLQYRPKLIVVDDPEDGEWVRTKENRDKTDRWLHSEIMPGLDARKGKLVVIGNLLHMDALLSRLRAPGTGFTVLEFPLIDKDGICTWPAMYPTEQSLKDKERDMGAIPWQREMLLKIVSDDEAIIKPEDIHYYDEFPKGIAAIKGHGIDLAISQKEGADFTAIASGEVFYVDHAPKIYIRPKPYNQHVTFHSFLQKVRSMPGELGGANLFFVEDVAYQKAAIQEMERALLPVIPMKPQGDKRARLQVVAPYIKNGTVLFPRAGCEELLGQMFNLGVESHDDMCLDGDTEVLTERGNVPIRDVRPGDRVMTRKGYKRVLWAGMTGIQPVITRFGLTGTPDHPVITPRGVIPLANMRESDMIYVWNRKEDYISEIKAGSAKYAAKSFDTTLASAPEGFVPANVQARFRFAISVSDSRDTNGVPKCGRGFPPLPLARIIGAGKAMLSIMNRWIGRTRLLPFFTMAKSTAANLKLNSALIAFTTGGMTAITNLPSPFTANFGSTTLVRSTALLTSITKMEIPSTTASLISPPKTGQSTSPITCARARHNRFENPGEICFSMSSRQQQRGTRAEQAESGTATIRKDSSARPVYNLLVEGAHEFFANGILVHNCDGLVYLLQGLVNQGLELPKIHWIET